MTYEGFYLWAEGVKKAGSDRPHEGDRGAGESASLRRAGGKVALDLQTHHTTRKPISPRSRTGSSGARELLAAAARRHPAVCDLIKKPNDNQQYMIDSRSDRWSRPAKSDSRSVPATWTISSSSRSERHRVAASSCQPRAGHHLRHDADHQPGPWRVPDARRLCRDARPMRGSTSGSRCWWWRRSWSG